MRPKRQTSSPGKKTPARQGPGSRATVLGTPRRKAAHLFLQCLGIIIGGGRGGHPPGAGPPTAASSRVAGGSIRPPGAGPPCHYCWNASETPDKPRHDFCNVQILLLVVEQVVARQGPGCQPPPAQGCVGAIAAPLVLKALGPVSTTTLRASTAQRASSRSERMQRTPGGAPRAGGSLFSTATVAPGAAATFRSAL